MKDVYLPPGGRTHTLLVSVGNANVSMATEIIYYILNLPLMIKNVVVVNEDISLTNQEEVEWALVTRVQPAKDLVVVEAVGSRLDPGAAFTGQTTKWGIDATIPADLPAEYFQRAGIPPAAEEMVEKQWVKYWSDEK